MPRRGSSDARCTVAGCRCEWIEVSKNRHLYCREHMLQANALYAEYKAANAAALATFADDALDQCIRLREEYARRFLDYEDMGAHRAYIGILKRVRSNAANRYSVAANAANNAANRYSVANNAANNAANRYSAAANAANYSAAANAANYSAAANAANNAACRRAAYNRWMTESAHFSDFVRA